MSTTDLEKSTRELFVKSYVDQIHMRTPLLEELQRRHQVTHKAGTFIERLVDTDDTDDLMQFYTVNDSLTNERKDTLEKPRFRWRKAQMPVQHDADEELENFEGDEDVQLLDLSEFLVKKAQDGMRKRLAKVIFNSGSTTPVADGDMTAFQSLVSALNHDTTYGTIGRSLANDTNDYWQGSDPAGLLENITSSSQDTSYTLTKGNLAKWINETDVADSMESPEDLMILMCPTLYSKLKGEFEAHSMYKGGLKQSQGITSMDFEGHEVVQVPYLQRTATMRSWVFILNLRFWELRIHKSRNFKFSGMKHQGENANGYDYYLGRIYLQGNLMCWHPKGSMWLSSVS